MASMVFIRCPRTDRPVPMGFAVDLLGLARLIARRTEFRCQDCGAAHVLAAGNAWLSLTYPLTYQYGRQQKHRGRGVG